MTASSATEWPVHGTIDGPIVMIGFGSIGKGTLPLIERHFGFDRERFVVIDPNDADRGILDERGIRFVHQAVTRENYRGLPTSRCLPTRTRGCRTSSAAMTRPRTKPPAISAGGRPTD